MKWVRSCVIVLVFLSLASPALAAPPSVIEIRIQGNVRIADGTAPKRAWSNRRSDTSRGPIQICFGPSNGNSLRKGLSDPGPRRSTCPSNGSRRL